MTGDRTFVIVKGPSRFGANFGLTTEHLGFLALSQTLSLSLNWEKEQCVQAAMTWRASSCAARALLWVVERIFRWVSIAGIEVSEITKGRAWGS